MKKKILIFSATLILLLGTTAISFATENKGSSKYEINSVNELKTTLSTMSKDKVTQTEKAYLTEHTDPAVIRDFIEEKDADAERVFEKINKELVIDENLDHYEKTYDIGDNCWVKFEVDEEKIPDFITSLKEKIIPEVSAISRSGHKTGWQKYSGKYSYTAKTTVNYGVVSGTYALRAYYQLTSGGIKVYDSLAAASDSGLLRASVTKEKISDAQATKPGASDCDLYATYKTTYGYSPIEWSKNHKMSLRIKYLSKDTVEKEIQSTRQWSFKNL